MGAGTAGVMGAGAGVAGASALRHEEGSHTGTSHTGTTGTTGTGAGTGSSSTGAGSSGQHKATIGEKIQGTVEQLAGKITKDPERVQAGEQLKTGNHPSQASNIYGAGNAGGASGNTGTGSGSGRSGI